MTEETPAFRALQETWTETQGDALEPKIADLLKQAVPLLKQLNQAAPLTERTGFGAETARARAGGSG